ncbi:MAG: hypothetical protein DRI54_02690 [Bacteroidetes bacterium]|nr:MAG: hypothetical protein DRI54_02690 [Bacteroidota bacterium]
MRALFLLPLFIFIQIKSVAQTDQELIYGTYFGGENVDIVYDIAIDLQGNSILVGKTSSATNIATTGAYQELYGGASDGFITKFDSDYNLLWSTYLGGEGFDVIFGIVTLTDGNIVVVGATQSELDISTVGAYQEDFNGVEDVFVSMFTSTGDILWSTYFGGSLIDRAKSIISDFENNIYVVGQTSSSNLATSGAYQEIIGGNTDGLLSMFNSNGNMIWTTYFGGEEGDLFTDVTINNQNELCLYGITSSETNIATENVHQETLSGSINSFITKFTLTGERLWGTYYGGDFLEQANSIDSDSNGNIIVSGYTLSDIGIATTGAHKSTRESEDSFLASFNSDGQINWGTYFGGSKDEEDSFVYVKGNDIYFTGRTNSNDGIAKGTPYQSEYAGEVTDEFFNSDIFLTKFDSSGQQVWGTYYGGFGSELSNGLAMLDENTVVLASSSGGSTDEVVTSDALNPENAGFADGLFAVFDVDLLISVNEIEPGALNIYPNPANNYFVINLPLTLPKNGMVEIYTLEGKRIVVFDHYISGNQIPLNLAPGMYIVSYHSGSIDLRTKIIVE